MWNIPFVVALALVVLTMSATTVLNRRSRRVTDPQGLPGRGIPLLHAAFLAGGPRRVVDTVLVRMEREGRVVISRANRVTVTDPAPRDPVEGVLITAVGGRAGRDLEVLRASVVGSPEVQGIGEALAARGLLRHPVALRAARRAWRLGLLVPPALLVLCAVAVAQWLSGPRPGSGFPPFALFVPLLIVTLVHLIVGRPPRSRITPAGRRQLLLMRGSSPWRPAGVSPEHAVLVGAFALEGTSALADQALWPLRDAMGGGPTAPVTLAKAGRSGRSRRSGGSDSAADSGYVATGAAWCGAATASCGASTDQHGHHGHSGHSGHSCGGSSHSSSHSCGGSSHSCGGSSHSCGSSSSCGGGGSSCGGGGGGCGS
ncbi:TIGR04222 domain-containing membrane protein [Kitasatospora sp. NPDC088134]|uniref:TIGR04222 domain-containing membrane protein n=1 Tax=Kitasatospora sp. NPDC088134 TaxID=3364071 RepID=UPI0037F6D63C